MSMYQTTESNSKYAYGKAKRDCLYARVLLKNAIKLFKTKFEANLIVEVLLMMC